MDSYSGFTTSWAQHIIGVETREERGRLTTG